MSNKTIEQAYFHFGNGGYTLTLSEREGCVRMMVDMDHHGSRMSIEFPIATMAMVDWMIGALGRVRDRAGQSPEYGPDYIVKKGPPQVTFRDGEEVDEGRSVSCAPVESVMTGERADDSERGAL